MLDELRLSDVCRYSGNFKLPGSFSRNYGSHAPDPAVVSGPPLLFQTDAVKSPVQLGSRKHVFIDDILVDTMQDVELTINQLTNPTQIKPQQINNELGGDLVVFELDGKICLRGSKCLYISEDGVNFEELDLSVRVPGTIFRDTNPNIGLEERFKSTATVKNRGVFLYVSPDGVHWRRNETCMLPIVSGGGCESFWDDQRGVYVNFLKRDSSFKTPEHPRGGKSAPMFQTREVFKAWPFKVLEKPYFEGWAFPGVTGEGPVIIDKNQYGQVYRIRAIKYPWAPDVYVSFVWRQQANAARQTDLGVSRDGINWKFYADQAWYIATSGTFAGKPIAEAMSVYGLIRRGDQIWQYAGYDSKAHSRGENFVRLIQRLDGFVSLDAGTDMGQVTTKSLIFKGHRLELNVAAKGEVRVGILDEEGNAIQGFTVADCDPIRSDSVHQVITWNDNSDVSKLAGRVVQLHFVMQDAKLYALQFINAQES